MKIDNIISRFDLAAAVSDEPGRFRLDRILIDASGSGDRNGKLVATNGKTLVVASIRLNSKDESAIGTVHAGIAEMLERSRGPNATQLSESDCDPDRDCRATARVVKHGDGFAVEVCEALFPIQPINRTPGDRHGAFPQYEGVIPKASEAGPAKVYNRELLIRTLLGMTSPLVALQPGPAGQMQLLITGLDLGDPAKSDGSIGVLMGVQCEFELG